MLLVFAAAGVVSAAGGYWADLQRLASGLRFGWLAVGWLLMTSGMVALAARWRAFFPADVRAPLAQLTAILLVGGLLNYALPGPAGELVGATMAGRRFGFPAERALAAGLAARFTGLGLAGLMALGLVESGGLSLPESGASWLRLATFVVAGGAVLLLVLAMFPDLWKRLARATTGRVSWLSRLHASVERLADAMGDLRHVGARAWLQAGAWALVGHGLVIAGISCAARSLAAEPTAAGLVFTYAASTAGAIVLFAFPGGQVGWDGMFAALLVSAARLDLPAAMALTLLVRLQQLLLVVVGAMLFFRTLRDGTRAGGG